ncbi:MAG: aminotransferase class V-fold PLP-dependent enzyme [Verrucomicrobiales bacterium]|nr:aminotransferase class V-fold PLP-dependent enzyme [Verrucomicrobiales bacterium]
MIYLDNNATTALDPLVRDEMLPWLGDENYGNPSAGYRFGKRAREAVETARAKVAELIGAEPEEITFTSGGTESNNTALEAARRIRPDRNEFMISAVEHSAIFEPCQFYESTGLVCRMNPVDSYGHLDLDFWEAALSDKTALASLIFANNETGVISPVTEAAEAAANAGAMFHTDAVQAVGKIPVSVNDAPIQMLSMSAHKLHGPKGVGALFVSRNSRFHPLLIGGGQEDGRRSGTENVAAIVGFGKAAELARADFHADSIGKLRDRFENGVLEKIEGVEVNGDRENRLPNTSNLYFTGVDGEGLLILLDEAGICCSPGSACSTGSVEPSRIIKAMGFSTERARSSVRFSLSKFTTESEIDEAVAQLEKAVSKLRVVMPKSGSRVVVNS